MSSNIWTAGMKPADQHKIIMKKAIRFFAMALTAVVISSCSTTKRSYDSAYTIVPFDTYAYSAKPDGTVVVKAYGTGANRAQAVDGAIQQALTDVIFTGIKQGPGAKTPIQPLVHEVNARERYAYYFNPFFSKGGEYLKYAAEDTSNKDGRTETSAQGRFAVGTTVTVDVPSLKRRLIEDEIIQP